MYTRSETVSQTSGGTSRGPIFQGRVDGQYPAGPIRDTIQAAVADLDELRRIWLGVHSYTSEIEFDDDLRLNMSVVRDGEGEHIRQFHSAADAAEFAAARTKAAAKFAAEVGERIELVAWLPERGQFSRTLIKRYRATA
jgi:methylmalonyl-CoA mutase N-terminal domain/subunit